MKKIQALLFAMVTVTFAFCPKLLANTDPNTKIKSQALLDKQLISAIQERDVNAIQSTLKGGANPNYVINKRTAIGWWLLYPYDPMNENDESQCLKVLHMLFEAGAKFQPQSDSLFFPISNGSSKVVELLINKGANPDAKIRGASLVELAESEGKDEVVSVLIKHGASPISRQEAAQLRLVRCAGGGRFYWIPRRLR